MNNRTLIIAEAGVNHNGSEETALALIEAAARSGVDAVKFQTFNAEELVSTGTEKADYQKDSTRPGDQLSMLKSLELSSESHAVLADKCNELNIEFMSTGFDTASVDMLVGLGVSRLKIPSGELTNLHLLGHMAGKDLPMILSTGMATLQEVKDAIDCIFEIRKEMGFVSPLSQILTLLHCTSNYPAAHENINLKAMQTLAAEFSLPVGYSDHTEGILVPPVAVAMGAVVIEKHFTLDRNSPGPDHRASIEPEQLSEMVDCIRIVEKCLGDGVKKPAESEIKIRDIARRSVFLKKSVKAGQKISRDNLILLRPGTGISPKSIADVAGRKAVTDLSEKHMLSWKDLS